MNARHSLLLLTAAVSLVGCGGAPAVDTGPVEMTFELTVGTNRALLDAALADARSGRATEAIAGLREMRRRYNLSTRQEVAVRTLIHDLERRVDSPAANR